MESQPLKIDSSSFKIESRIQKLLKSRVKSNLSLNFPITGQISKLGATSATYEQTSKLNQNSEILF